jgi:pyridoxine kinase
MSTVLCLTSQVARGYVGGTAARIALERLGHECWLLPTVVLSNHPGHPRFAGEQVPVGRLRAMLEALQANGWLGEVDAVMLGYMPSTEHVGFAVSALEAVRKEQPEAVCLCDPIIGDTPGGLYVEDDIAAAIRDEFIPVADIITPNRFELEWLGGKTAKLVKAAVKSARALGPARVLVTSVMGQDAQTLVNLLVEEKSAWMTNVTRRKGVPHGSGDLMAALYLGHLLKGAARDEALGRATGSVEEALDESEKSDELQLAAAPSWAEAESWSVEAVDA